MPPCGISTCVHESFLGRRPVRCERRGYVYRQSLSGFLFADRAFETSSLLVYTALSLLTRKQALCYSNIFLGGVRCEKYCEGRNDVCGGRRGQRRSAHVPESLAASLMLGLHVSVTATGHQTKELVRGLGPRTSIFPCELPYR